MPAACVRHRDRLSVLGVLKVKAFRSGLALVFGPLRRFLVAES